MGEDEIKVGSAYVDIGVKGLDKMSDDIEKAIANLRHYAEQLTALEAERNEIQKQITNLRSSSSGETSAEAAAIKQLSDALNKVSESRRKIIEAFGNQNQALTTAITNYGRIADTFNALTTAAEDAAKAIEQLNNIIKDASVKEALKQIQDAAKDLGSLSKTVKDASTSTNKTAEAVKKTAKSLNEATKAAQTQAKANKENAKAIEASSRAAKNNAKAELDAARAAEKHAKEVAQVRDNAKSAVTHFNSLLSATNLLKGVLVSLSAKKLYDTLITPNAEMESYLVQFNTLLGSMDKAESIMSKITDIAAATPFTFFDISSVIKQLSQFGTIEEDLIPQFMKLADLSQGNAEKLDGIAQAYGKIKAAGRATYRELIQFINNGVPIIKTMADMLGVTEKDIMQMARRSEVSFQMVSDAIDELTTNGGRFEGLIENMSQTLEGRMSTLRDNITLIMRDIGEESFKELSHAIKNILDEINRLRDSGELEEITTQLGASLANLVDKLINLFKTLVENRDTVDTIILLFVSLTTTVKVATTAMKLFDIAASIGIATLGPWAVALAAVAAAITVTIEGIKDLKETEQRLTATSQKLVREINNSTADYEKQSKAIENNASKAKSLADELNSLMSVQGKSEEQQRRINEIVEQLNSLIPGMELFYDTEYDEINKDTGALRDYITAWEELEQKKNNFDRKANLESQKDDLLSEIYSQVDEYNYLKDKYMSLYEERNTAYGKRYVDISKEMGKTRQEMAILAKSIPELVDKYNLLNDAEQGITETTEDLAEAEEKLAKNTPKAVETLSQFMDRMRTEANAAKSAIDDLHDSTSDFYQEVNGYVDDTQKLTDIINKAADGYKFTGAEMLNLTRQFPELFSMIQQEADGWRVDEEAVRSLRQEKIQAAIDAIRNVDAQTLNVIANTRTKISNMQAESKAIGALIAMYERLGGQKAAAGLMAAKGNIDDKITDLKKLQVEQEQQHIKNQKEIQALQKQLDMAMAGSGGGAAGGGGGGGAANTAEDMVRNLKWQYDMGIIEAQEYYDTLEQIANAYYAEGSKEWQQYVLEIKRGREQIEEEKKKALEAEFETGLEQRQNYIEDEEFYDRQTLEQKIERLKELREYIKKSYDDRLIDYERFQDEMRDIDKEIYSSEKELIEKNLDELNDIRKKKYDEAVKKVEDFYEAIYNAQKKADREAELEDLRQAEKLYEGAVSRQGQEKLKKIQQDIQKLEREKLNAELEEQRTFQLENLEAKYKALEEAQNDYYETIQTGVKTTAQIVEEYTRQIADFFNSISGILSTVRSDAMQSVQNITINNNNYDAAAARASYDMTRVISNYGFK